MLVLWLLWWWTTWLQHLLHQIKSDPCFCFILTNGKKVQQIKMPHIWSKRVPMLIYKPFKFCCICVTCSNILWLEMFQLTMDIVPITHTWEETNTYQYYLQCYAQNICEFHWASLTQYISHPRYPEYSHFQLIQQCDYILMWQCQRC